MVNDKTLFAISAIFDNPDKIIVAAEQVVSSGYKKFDVNSPYPIHGMEKAMKLKPSKLGFITLAFGLIGAGSAILFMWWIMSINYPLLIGGKPNFSLPAFIPVSFEVTVLLATLSTVIGMIAFFFKLPNNKNALHDTDYIKDVSGDKFGIYIEARDDKFELEEVKSLFRNLDAIRIDEIYLPEKEIYPLYQPRFIIFLLIVFIVTSGLTYLTLNKLMLIQPFSWMSIQDKVTPQGSSKFFTDDFSMRTPVKGTVARGFIPYASMGMPSPKDSLMTNPLLPTKEILGLGQRKFLTFCSPCHGNFADGDSRLRGQFVSPPTLHSERARNFSDAMIYHIITNGQNAMPSYASQISREERWAIVNYVRVLQKAKNASPQDLMKIKKEQIQK